LPLCDKKRAAKEPLRCERVKSWRDSSGVEHKEPFKLLPENYTALEIYDKATELGTLHRYEFQRGEETFARYYAGLDMLDFVIKHNFEPGELSIDEMDKLLYSISLIHKMKMENIKAN